MPDLIYSFKGFRENLDILPCTGKVSGSPLSSTFIGESGSQFVDNIPGSPGLQVSKIVFAEYDQGLPEETLDTGGSENHAADRGDESGRPDELDLSGGQFSGFGGGGSLGDSQFEGFGGSPVVGRLRDFRPIIESARLTVARNRRDSLSRRSNASSSRRLISSPCQGVPVG